MKKINIYYNSLGHPSEMDKDGVNLYDRIHLNKYNSVLQFSLDKNLFSKWWYLINSEDFDEKSIQYVDNYKILNNIFYRYNNYNTNPLSSNEGQNKIKNSPVQHTSMSVGDIIQINKKYYIVSNFGFKEVIFK